MSSVCPVGANGITSNWDWAFHNINNTSAGY